MPLHIPGHERVNPRLLPDYVSNPSWGMRSGDLDFNGDYIGVSEQVNDLQNIRLHGRQDNVYIDLMLAQCWEHLFAGELRGLKETNI